MVALLCFSCSLHSLTSALKAAEKEFGAVICLGENMGRIRRYDSGSSDAKANGPSAHGKPKKRGS